MHSTWWARNRSCIWKYTLKLLKWLGITGAVGLITLLLNIAELRDRFFKNTEPQLNQQGQLQRLQSLILEGKWTCSLKPNMHFVDSENTFQLEFGALEARLIKHGRALSMKDLKAPDMKNVPVPIIVSIGNGQHIPLNLRFPIKLQRLSNGEVTITCNFYLSTGSELEMCPLKDLLSFNEICIPLYLFENDGKKFSTLNRLDFTLKANGEVVWSHSRKMNSIFTTNYASKSFPTYFHSIKIKSNDWQLQ